MSTLIFKTDKNTFINIYKKLSLPLTKFISKRIGRDQEAVEEVFSRTIHAAFKGFSAFKYKSTYFTWLCRIALNKLADYYRDQVDENSMLITPALKDLAEIGSKEPSHEEKMALNELCASVRDCLNLLPDEKRRLLWFRYWKDLSLKEISKKLGVSERAVEGQIFRTKKKLKEILEIKHPEISPSYEAPSALRPGYLLAVLRRERNPSEAEIASHSSASLRSRCSAKGDKKI